MPTISDPNNLGLSATRSLSTLAYWPRASQQSGTSSIAFNQPTFNQPTLAYWPRDRVQPTNLQPTNLQPTNLQPTNLQPTNLQSTNLQPTNLQPTNLQPSTKKTWYNRSTS
ncbi:MAG: hypothetical protein F6K56_28780 [Moorea sp. SIO3G5]|nr:hypothetical protein [Moorena sp. SIO3G5]